MEFIFAPQNLPFSVALAVMLAIALLEGVLTLLGMGFSGLLDSLLPDAEVDFDLDVDLDVDLGTEIPVGSIDPGLSVDPSGAGEIGSASALSRLLGWLSVGRVPVLVLLVIFLTAFGLSGLVLQGFLHDITGFLLPAWLAWVPALVLALPTTRVLGRGIGRLIPKEETSAVSRDSFVGRIAVITLGVAEKGKPAQARLRDGNGALHYVMVEPDQAGEAFAAGSQVLLVSFGGVTFRAIANSSAALVDEPQGRDS